MVFGKNHTREIFLEGKDTYLGELMKAATN